MQGVPATVTRIVIVAVDDTGVIVTRRRRSVQWYYTRYVCRLVVVPSIANVVQTAHRQPRGFSRYAHLNKGVVFCTSSHRPIVARGFMSTTSRPRRKPRSPFIAYKSKNSRLNVNRRDTIHEYSPLDVVEKLNTNLDKIKSPKRLCPRTLEVRT